MLTLEKVYLGILADVASSIVMSDVTSNIYNPLTF